MMKTIYKTWNNNNKETYVYNIDLKQCVFQFY